MTVIDFHSHVLPGIDDGSRSIRTSLEILRTSEENGVGIIVATPHFYAWEDRIEQFLEKREAAMRQVQEVWNSDRLRLFCGAEVAYFEGISRAEKMELLTIKNERNQYTGTLLLEMPFQQWDSAVLKEVRILCEERGFRLVIAHLERYLKIAGNKKAVEELLSMPVGVQINAGSLTDWKQRGALIKMFKKGQAQLLGSDCHGMHRRPPNLWEGRRVLEKKLGADFLAKLDRAGEEYIKTEEHHV